MSLIKSIFKQKEEQIKSYSDFWKWFQENEKDFYNVVKRNKDIKKNFFDKLSPKLNQLREGFFYLTGMYDTNTAELIITADGIIKNFVFVEEIISSAPVITGWKFTAHKPATDINFAVSMDGYEFSTKNLHFYPNDNSNFPDEIDITFVYDDYNEDYYDTIINGVSIFLDNFLGELESVTTIDSFTVTGSGGKQKLVPIGKLKDYLIWRQKEFVEKYDGLRYDTENDEHSVLEAELESGNKLLAVINTDLLNWDRKASHPWFLTITMEFDGEKLNGMPDDETYNLLNEVEDKIMLELKDYEGYLYIGRQTADGEREIYFACKDFRKPSKVVSQIQENYSNEIEINYDIYLDKYWQSLDRFINN